MANKAINSLDFGSNSDVYTFTLPYGECETAAATAAKEVTVDNFSLEKGAMVVVKFTYANSASSPTLNVNGTGAKAIMRYGTTAASTSASTSGWQAGAVTTFVYDGTNWVREYWNNSTYTNVALGQGYATCSTAAATAAKAATLSSYSLTTGGIVAVKFTYAVPASATLNINSKGAKAIYYKGAAIPNGIICAGEIATFIYDGTRYHLLALDRDRFNTTLVPFGTSIGSNSNLNTTEFLKVGNYYCSQNTVAATLTNSPSTSAFMMTVYSPLSTAVDNETTGTWVYRLRKLQVYTGAEFVQYCYSNGTAGNWIYGDWLKVMKSNHFAVDSKLSSGTEIGSITIDGEKKTFYAPTPTASSVTGTTTDKVLGEATTFTASGTAVGANGTAAAITGFGTHTTAAAITAMNTTTIKNPTVTAVSIPNVTGNTAVSIPNVTGNTSVTASKISSNTSVTATKISSYGSLPSFSASVDANGVLSFSWSAGAIPTGSNVTATKTAYSDVTATNTTLGTALSASKVTLGTAISASSVSTSNVTVATTAKTTANAITALGTATTATVLTGVKVTTQPTITVGTNDKVTALTGVTVG